MIPQPNMQPWPGPCSCCVNLTPSSDSQPTTCAPNPKPTQVRFQPPATGCVVTQDILLFTITFTSLGVYTYTVTQDTFYAKDAYYPASGYLAGGYNGGVGSGNQFPVTFFAVFCFQDYLDSGEPTISAWAETLIVLIIRGSGCP